MHKPFENHDIHTYKSIRPSCIESYIHTHVKDSDAKIDVNYIIIKPTKAEYFR